MDVWWTCVAVVMAFEGVLGPQGTLVMPTQMERNR